MILTPGTCSACGCTDDLGCMTPEGPCSWVDEDRTLCSACVTSPEALLATVAELASALTELATAVEFGNAWERPDHRARAALDRAWSIVDPDHAHRDLAARETGCVQCGGAFDHHDHMGAELCGRCAATIPEAPCTP